jgi:hypothetical protein
MNMGAKVRKKINNRCVKSEKLTTVNNFSLFLFILLLVSRHFLFLFLAKRL